MLRKLSLCAARRLAGQHARPAATPSLLSLIVSMGLLAGLWAIPERVWQTEANAAMVDTPSAQAGTVTVGLLDRLVAGLQARLDSELQFVGKVVDEVHAGHLPQRLVDETFFWAREKAEEPRNGRKRRPILYFRPAMTLRAKAAGVEL